jgi:hypothetical protein
MEINSQFHIHTTFRFSFKPDKKINSKQGERNINLPLEQSSGQQHGTMGQASVKKENNIQYIIRNKYHSFIISICKIP